MVSWIQGGKTTTFVVADQLSTYAHFIAISHPYMTVSIAQVFFENIFKIHGMPKSIVCDQDPTFTSNFWTELVKLQGTSFNFSSAYHPQTDGKTEVVNRTLEMYLRCFASNQQKEWGEWLAWAENSYNTSWHSTIKNTPFPVVYNQDPSILLTYLPRTARVEAVGRELRERDQMMKELKNNIHAAQECMKRLYDDKHRKEELEESDWHTWSCSPTNRFRFMCAKTKLAARFYGPFKLLRKSARWCTS